MQVTIQNSRGTEPHQSLEPERVNILNVGVSALNMTQMLDIIGEWIADRQSNYVYVTGVHGV